jgi:hypothetical protein
MKFGTGAKIEYFFQTTKQLSKKCKKMLQPPPCPLLYFYVLINPIFRLLFFGLAAKCNQ